MAPNFFTTLTRITGLAALAVSASIALAEPQHGIAMYGDPVLPPDFEHLPYTNPDAPVIRIFISLTDMRLHSFWDWTGRSGPYWRHRVRMQPTRAGITQVLRAVLR